MKAAHTGPPLVFERPPGDGPVERYCLLRFVSQSM